MKLVLRSDADRIDLTEAWTDLELVNGFTTAAAATITLRDPNRQLINHRMLDPDATPPRLDLNGRTYRLQSTAKDGPQLALTLEDDRIARLRDRHGELTATAGSIDLNGFLRRLATDAGVPVELLDTKDTGEQYARDDDETSWEAIRRLAGDAEAHALMGADGLIVAGDAALAARHEVLELTEQVAGVDIIDFVVDARRRAETAAIEVRTEPGGLTPGMEVAIRRLRPARGRWIVSQVTYRPHRTTTALELVRFGTAHQDTP